MRKTFNFLDAQTGLDKVIADLERRHPDRSHGWIRNEAKTILDERNKRNAGVSQPHHSQGGRR